MINYFKVICLLVILFACGNQNNDDVSWENNTNQFKRKIPNHFSNEDFKRLSNFCNKSEIEQLTNGYNGLQIRLFVSYRNSDSVRLYTILKQERSVKVIVNEMLIHYNANSGFIDTIMKKNSYPIPKSGYENFIKRLDNSDIYDLPDYSDINGYNIPTDAKNAFIEIATKKTYKICLYPALDINSALNNESKGVAEIINYLDTELNLKPVL